MFDRNHRGFTLLDLAIILAILGSVQMAVINPLGERAREESRKSSCQSNLRKCSIALAMYTGDYDSFLPSSVLAASPPGSAPTDAQVINYLTSSDPWPPNETRAVTWTQVLRPYFQDINCIYCPSDTPRTRASYWMKYAVDLAWRSSASPAKHGGDFAYPASQIIFYEHSAWHSFDAAGINNGSSINVAYLDGHTAMVTIKNGPTGYPSVSDERSGASAIRLGAPSYFNYDGTTNTSHPGIADYTDPGRYYDKY